MQVKNGNTISVHYKGTLSDGTVFDESRTRGEALKFTVGSGRMIGGFNNAVIGMATGETKTVSLTSDQAYGPLNPDATQVVPKEAFGEGFEFKLGEMIQGNAPTGPFIAKIQEVKDTEVTLDFNHPLAGKDLKFEIELVSIDDTGATTE